MTTTDLDSFGVDALRSDGGCVHLRSIQLDDGAGIRALNAQASDRSIYLRFFSLNRATAESYVAKLLRPNGHDHHGAAALVADEIVGVGSFERLGPDSAEIALLVDDTRHRQGIGTLLLEQLITAARRAGVRKLVADVLAENNLMAQVLRDLGYAMRTETDHGTNEVVFDIAVNPDVVAATERRERTADAASMRAVLAPRSIAVLVGAGHPALSERRLLDHLDCFTGTVHTVGPDRGPSQRVPSVATIERLPTVPDLAIISAQAGDVSSALRDCGRTGVRAVFVLGPGRCGLGSNAVTVGNEASAIARHYGMRLIGPGGAGVVNTDPDIRLNATLMSMTMPKIGGRFGLVAQSGELGLATMLAAAARGTAVSQFAALGDSLDVNEGDLLQSWADDPNTQVVGLLLDHLVDAAGFSAIARRFTRHTPILAVVPAGRFGGDEPGRSEPGAVRAVLRASGVRIMATTQELLDTVGTVVRGPLETYLPEATALIEPVSTRERNLDLTDLPALLSAYGIAYEPADAGHKGRAASFVIAAHRDPNYGPLIRVENALDLRSECDELALAPVDVADVHELIARTVRARRLDGRRPLALPAGGALAAVMARVAQLVADFPEIADLEFTLAPTEPLTVAHAAIRRGAAVAAHTPLVRQPPGPDAAKPCGHTPRS